MAEPSPPPPAPPAPPRLSAPDRRLLWFVLAACWLALVGWAWYALTRPQRPRVPLPDLAPRGAYHKVQDVTGPVSLRLDDGREVRLAGVADPKDAAEGQRAAERLRQLVGPDAAVYVEIEPRLAGEDQALATASVFLPPADAPPLLPFPYDKSRLLGAVLVQEGLARAKVDAPYRYREEFQGLEDDARRHRRGLWAAD